MSAIYILHGFFGSGKSTWAKNFAKEHSDTKIVSADGFRTMLNGKYKYVPELDNIITYAMDDLIDSLLNNEYNVIVDCGNLTEARREWRSEWATERIAVIFPKKDKEWHVKNNAAKPHSNSWDEIWESEHKSYEPIIENQYDRIIKVEEWEGS